MSEKRIIRRRRVGSTGSDSEEEEEVVLSGASQDEGVSKTHKEGIDLSEVWMQMRLIF